MGFYKLWPCDFVRFASYFTLQNLRPLYYNDLQPSYPESGLGKVSDIPLVAARGKVVKLRVAVAEGRDPAGEAAASRHAAKAERHRETVRDIGEWYFQECVAGRHKPNAKRPKRQSTIELELRFFRQHIVRDFGNQKLRDLTRSSIQEFINIIVDGGAPSVAQRCRAILHAMFAFAQWHELVDTNPCQFVFAVSHQVRETTLTEPQLRVVWQTLISPIDIDGIWVSAGVREALLLTMITLQRRGEVAGMRVSELDLERKLWTIPSSRTKNYRTHVVPLSDLAVEHIQSALDARLTESEYLFPTPRKVDKPIEARALTRAFGRLRSALDFGDIQVHDFRRTGATTLTSEQLGFPRFTVSKVLNHASDTGNAAAVTGVYDQNEYLPEKRRALDAWAGRLMEIVEGGERADNVVTLQ